MEVWVRRQLMSWALVTDFLIVLAIGPTSAQIIGVQYKVGSFPIASCKSADGTIGEISGQNTSQARMAGRITDEDLQEYCSRQVDNDAARMNACLHDEVQSNQKRMLLASADCLTGKIKAADGKDYQLRGPARSPSNGGSTSLSWSSVQTKKALDGSCASGAPPITEQFRLLCPATVSRIAAQVRDYADEAYRNQFWKIDNRGIYDTAQNRVVLSLKDPLEGLTMARAAFQESKVVTAKEFSTHRILAYTMSFKSGGRDIFQFEIDQLDGSREAKITKMIINHSGFADLAGVRVGTVLSNLPSYNWRKYCKEEEAQIVCHSPSSPDVYYGLDKNTVSGRVSLKSIIDKSKVMRIEVDAPQ